MTLISKGTKIFVFADTKITLLDGGEPTNERTIPNGEGNVKDYYGDLEQAQQDLAFQPASYIGTTTGKTSVVNKTLYYQVLLENVVDKRTSHGLFGWGSGTYEKIPWYGWASSADITDNESVALTKFDKRTDAAAIADIQKANAELNPNVTKSSTKTTTTKASAAQNGGGNNSNNTMLYIAIGLVVIVGGVVTYIFIKDKKKKALQAMQAIQIPIPQQL